MFGDEGRKAVRFKLVLEKLIEKRQLKRVVSGFVDNEETGHQKKIDVRGAGAWSCLGGAVSGVRLFTSVVRLVA